MDLNVFMLYYWGQRNMFSKEQFLQQLKERIFYSDGAMGTQLQAQGFRKGCPDEWNLTHPEIVRSIHRAYAEAGADIILTNTFGANRFKLKQYQLAHKLDEINQAGVRLAREAAPYSIIAGDISELNEYVEPLGKITFDQALEAYREQVAALKEADVIILETISDIKLMKAALIAAKESGKLVIASMTFDGLRTTTGTDVKTFVKIADALDAEVIGVNCSSGPKEILATAKIISSQTNKPVIIQPNAGLPRLEEGRTTFNSTPEEFAQYASQLVDLGVNILGGCCGTNPEFIRALVQATKNRKPVLRNNVFKTCFCSRTRTVELGEKTLIIGERINPSGRKEFREEVKEGKTNLIRQESLKQKEEGASLLDINVGVPGTDEVANLKKTVELVQNLVDLPLVLDSSNPQALLEALKQSDGKPVINSVNGSFNSLNSILPLAKKFGAAVIALCLDERGIPKTAEERMEIAEKIILEAGNRGIKKEDILIDGLTLTLAADPKIEEVLLETIRRIKQKGHPSILGVSNISFGLPNRQEINQKFFTKSSQAGLDLAILNPQDWVYRQDTEISWKVDAEKVDYQHLNLDQKLFSAILHGDKENVLPLVEEALASKKAMEINNIFLSALEEVGRKFKAKTFFLPQVMLAAETMKLAFSRLKTEIKNKKEERSLRIVFATVENDIHDLGKNMVITLLESYGYEILDLGKDVPLERIIATAVNEKADVIALSALMTTTAPEMERIVKELQTRNLKIPVLIGGAVITSDYAQNLGAAYSPDALSAVKAIQQLMEKNMKNKKIVDVLKEKPFTLSVELVPPRNGTDVGEVLRCLEFLQGKVDFVSITKGAGGSLRGGSLPLTYLAQERYGMNVLAHFVCRERSRQEIENDLTDLHLFGITNILALRGDAPAGAKEEAWNGDYQYAYLLVEQILRMNQGIYLPTPLMKVSQREGLPTSFGIAVAGHPEDPISEEIEHLRCKIQAGAEVIITQMIFSFEEYHCYVKNLRAAGINLPVIAGIRPYTKYSQVLSTEEFFKLKVAEELKTGLKQFEKDEAQSREFGLSYTAKMIQKLKDYGCPGVHLFTLNDLELIKELWGKMK